MFCGLLLLSFFSFTIARNCDYQCEQSGGCSVKYVGPPRGGKISGKSTGNEVLSSFVLMEDDGQQSLYSHHESIQLGQPKLRMTIILNNFAQGAVSPNLMGVAVLAPLGNARIATELLLVGKEL